MSGLGRWFGWAGTRTCNALIACAVGTNVCVVSNSTICQQCNPSEGEYVAQRVVVPAMSLQVRVFAADLDCVVARIARYNTIAMRTHSSDGRVGERYRNTHLRRTEDFSQITAT